MKNSIFSKESVLRICVIVFAIMCFQCVSAKCKNGSLLISETREKSYYNENTPSTLISWKTFKMKKLSLLCYGGIKNDEGDEANCFEETGGEYIKLLNNGKLIWNNRNDGNTSYKYQIDGNRLYIKAIGNSPAVNKWIDIVVMSKEIIKTIDNLGTYRYFRYQQ
jgi:hypothetical protein